MSHRRDIYLVFCIFTVEFLIDRSSFSEFLHLNLKYLLIGIV